jgi:hypothetical protein
LQHKTWRTDRWTKCNPIGRRRLINLTDRQSAML